jgi:hypothetical protein
MSAVQVTSPFEDAVTRFNETLAAGRRIVKALSRAGAQSRALALLEECNSAEVLRNNDIAELPLSVAIARLDDATARLRAVMDDGMEQPKQGREHEWITLAEAAKLCAMRLGTFDYHLRRSGLEMRPNPNRKNGMLVRRDQIEHLNKTIVRQPQKARQKQHIAAITPIRPDMAELPQPTPIAVAAHDGPEKAIAWRAAWVDNTNWHDAKDTASRILHSNRWEGT